MSASLLHNALQMTFPFTDGLISEALRANLARSPRYK